MINDEVREEYLELTKNLVIKITNKLARFTARTIEENDVSILRDIIACQEAAIHTIFRDDLADYVSRECINMVAKYYKEE